MDINHCSPSQQENYKQTNSCYDEAGLYKLIDAYNRSHPNTPIALRTANNKAKKPFKTLWCEMQKALEATCNTDEVCWTNHLGVKNDPHIRASLRPEKPSEWHKNPNTWLSNFNIEAVLIQYETANSPMYKFLGVYSADFLRKAGTTGDQCYHRELCAIDIQKLYSAGTRTLGMVINLDDHDEPGSHWTSLFVCIDPTMKCFGAYYYDSVAKAPPPDMTTFMNDLQSQAGRMKAITPFKNMVNTIPNQYKNTECGMFSIYNQLKWLHEIKKGASLSFADIVKSDRVTDDKMTRLRDFLFRPIHIKK